MLALLFPVLCRVSAWPSSASSANAANNAVPVAEQRMRAFAALRELFARIAERGPLLILIDDWQWVDADTVALVDALVKPPHAPPFALVCTTRPGAAALGTTTCDVRRLLLAGLAPDDVKALAGALGKGGVRIGSLDEARGHPLFVRELLLQSEGDTHARLDDVLWRRIEQLPKEERALLDLACVAGTPLSPHIFADAAALQHAVVLDAARALCSARLLRADAVTAADAFEPYHDRVRELVSGRLDDTARRDVHRHLARAIEAGPGHVDDPASLMRHLAGAGDNARAAVFAERAAERASAAFAFQDAAGLYRGALALGGATGAERRRLLGLVGQALANAGRAPEAARILLDAATDAAGDEALHFRSRALVLFVASGNAAEAKPLVKEILTAVGAHWPSNAFVAVAQLLLVRARLSLRGFQPAPATELSTLPPVSRARLEIQEGLSDFLWNVDPLRGVVFLNHALLDGLKSGQPRYAARALLREAALTSGMRGQLEKAMELIERARLIAKNELDRGMPFFVNHYRGYTHLFGGEFVRAIEYYEEAERTYVADVHELGSIVEVARMFKLMAQRCGGYFAGVVNDSERRLDAARARGDRFLEATILGHLNIRWLCADKPDEGLRELEDSRRMTKGRTDLDGAYEMSRAEAHLYTRRPAPRPKVPLVSRLFMDFVWLLNVERRSLEGRQALVAGGTSGPARAARKARSLMKAPLPYARLKGHLLLAGAHAARGDAEAATVELRASAAAADAQRLSFFAAIARRHLGVIVGGDEGKALVEAADVVIRAQEVKSPERMAAMFAPGFERFDR